MVRIGHEIWEFLAGKPGRTTHRTESEQTTQQVRGPKHSFARSRFGRNRSPTQKQTIFDSCFFSPKLSIPNGCQYGPNWHNSDLTVGLRWRTGPERGGAECGPFFHRSPAAAQAPFDNRQRIWWCMGQRPFWPRRRSRGASSSEV
jgi:hypothetical protein